MDPVNVDEYRIVIDYHQRPSSDLRCALTFVLIQYRLHGTSSLSSYSRHTHIARPAPMDGGMCTMHCTFRIIGPTIPAYTWIAKLRIARISEGGSDEQ